MSYIRCFSQTITMLPQQQQSFIKSTRLVHSLTSNGFFWICLCELWDNSHVIVAVQSICGLGGIPNHWYHWHALFPSHKHTQDHFSLVPNNRWWVNQQGCFLQQLSHGQPRQPRQPSIPTIQWMQLDTKVAQGDLVTMDNDLKTCQTSRQSY